jgi:hypothetical protein
VGVFRNLARIAVLAVIVGIAWVGFRWVSGPNAEPLKGCPANAVEYLGRFPKFKDKLKEQKKSVAEWTGFRKQMEQLQSRGTIELCAEPQLKKMKDVEASIPVSGACSSVSATPNVSERNEEVRELIFFRDCSEAKAKEYAGDVKARATEGNTAQLHSKIKDVTKITTDSIDLLTEFREQANEAQQTKCWLRSTIEDCAK